MPTRHKNEQEKYLQFYTCIVSEDSTEVNFLSFRVFQKLITLKLDKWSLWTKSWEYCT